MALALGNGRPVFSQMVFRANGEEPMPVTEIKVDYDAAEELEPQQQQQAASHPFRDNLGAHEDRCRSLERELLEALERRDWHASIVLPSDCGAPDRRGRELRRLLRGGQAKLPWWKRAWRWFRRDI
jgi:hypothetical protein